MSHSMGIICRDHGWVVLPDTCPEPDCNGGHGYTLGDCGPRCFEHPDFWSDAEEMKPEEEWMDLGDGREAMPLNAWIKRARRVTDE